LWCRLGSMTAKRRGRGTSATCKNRSAIVHHDMLVPRPVNTNPFGFLVQVRGDTICGSKAALEPGRYLIIVDSKAGASTSNVARELTGPVLICGLRRRKPQNCGVARLHYHSCGVGAA
jgi:hypothetical protein